METFFNTVAERGGNWFAYSSRKGRRLVCLLQWRGIETCLLTTAARGGNLFVYNSGEGRKLVCLRLQSGAIFLKNDITTSIDPSIFASRKTLFMSLFPPLCIENNRFCFTPEVLKIIS